MNINDYYQQLNTRSQEIFNRALDEPRLLSKVHSAAAEIFQLAEAVSDRDEQSMLKAVCSQLESSCLALSLGLYRPAIGALRLALELGIGCIYFSANKLEHREWLRNGDLKWSIVNGEADGVLSQRFVMAFFPELADQSAEFATRAGDVYRSLSEYVHGNSDTWMASGIALTHNDALRAFYEKKLDDVVVVLKFAFCCRYLKNLSNDTKDTIHAAASEVHHVAAIRECFGGPKDIK